MSKGQVSVELLIIFAALLAVYAVIFPSIAASYGKAVGSVDENIQQAGQNRVENLVQQCNLLSEGSVFEQKIQLARNATIAGLELIRGVNLVRFNRTVEGCELTVINAGS